MGDGGRYDPDGILGNRSLGGVGLEVSGPDTERSGDYRVTVLVEVMWKAVAVILNSRFTACITYHRSLHGFWAGRGTGIATLKVKLLQQVSALKDAVLNEILLELHKAYDDLKRSRCLEILEGYGMGTRDLHLLHKYWERLKMVARVGGYYR